ncbi:hypothetical protein ACJ41O_001898 [Fusarium nematophilum]
MSEHREIKIVLSPKHNTNPAKMTGNHDAAWPDQILHSARSWFTTLLNSKPTLSRSREEFEPLLDEGGGSSPRHTVSSIFRPTTSRSMKKYNQIL